MLPYLILLILFIFTSYFIGGCINFKTESRGFIRIFERLLSGSVLVAVLFALVKTQGASMMGILVLLAILYGFRFGGIKIINPFHTAVKENIWQKNTLVLLPVLLFSFAIQLFRLRGLNGDWFSLHRDFVFYGRLAESISQSGIETKLHNTLGLVHQSPSLYHYLEIWQTALLGYVSGLNTTLIFFIIIIPFYFTIIITGIIGLLERKFRLIWWHFAMAPLVLFLSAPGFADLTFLTQPIFPVSTMDVALYNYPKLMVSFAGVIFLMSIKPKCIVHSGFVVAFTGLMFPSIIPALYSGWVLWCLTMWRLKKTDSSSFFLAILFPVLSTVGILMFYGISSMVYPSTPISFQWSTITFEFYTSRYGVLSIIYNTLFYLLSIISMIGFSALFFGLLLGWKWPDTDFKKNAGLLGLIILAGIFSFSLFFMMYDSWQLLQNIFIPMIVIITFLLLAELMNGSYAPWKKVAGLVFIILNLWLNAVTYDGKFKKGRKLDEHFYHQLSKEIKANEDMRSGYFKSYTPEMSTGDKSPFFAITGLNTALFVSSFNPVSFSIHEIPLNPMPLFHYTEKARIERSPFYVYVKQQKMNGKFEDIESSTVEFINEHNIEILFFEQKEQLPASLLEQEHKLLFNEEENFGVYFRRSENVKKLRDIIICKDF